MPKRVGQDPFKSSLGESDRAQQGYKQRTRDPNLFKGNTTEKQKSITERGVQGFRQNLEMINRRNMGG